jgi:hypothetical protein
MVLARHLALVAATAAMIGGAPAAEQSGRPNVLQVGKVANGHGFHPYMQSAEFDLRAAADELGRADSDFGGHRNQALALVRQALDEIEAAYAFGGQAHEGPLAPR